MALQRVNRLKHEPLNTTQHELAALPGVQCYGEGFFVTLLNHILL